MREITILGAGLVGSAMAILFRQKGYPVTLFEKRPDIRLDKTGGGRSINLALSLRGWKTIERVGLKEAISHIALPMYGRYLHQTDGAVNFQAYGKNKEAIYSVSRRELNKRLLSRAEETGVKIHFDTRCTHVDIRTNEITIADSAGGERKQSCDFLMGADGAFSSLRTAYSFHDRTNFKQFYIQSGYKELSIPPAKGNSKWSIQNDGLHIWPRHKFMMIALPNTDGSFTCTLFAPFEGKNSFDYLRDDQTILDFFQLEFPKVFPLMPDLIKDFHHNPTSSLVTINIAPWHFKDKSCLIGDAAHAVVPFYGQGLNAGLEDCSVFEDLMEKNSSNWETLLSNYENIRKPNGDAIAELSLLNFNEMQDSVADPAFLERKKIDKELGRLFPDLFNSVYEMVAFSHLPYTRGLHAMKTQDALLREIQAEGDFFTLINHDDYKSRLRKRLEQYAKTISK